MKKLKPSILLLAALALAAGPATATCLSPPSFPSVPGDDVTFSIGKAIIWVEPAFAYLVSSTPGWGYPSPGYWSSPFLYDSSTTIGYSAAHVDASSGPDFLGTTVGSNPITVSDAPHLLGNPFEGSPTGVNEIHTELYSLDLTEPSGCNTGFAIRGGRGQGVSPYSFGEVEASQFGPDFPATSFFKVFVEILTPFGTLHNTDPLLVMNPEICSLPPEVVYIHGLTPAVDIYFGNGQRFGIMRLAGHQSAPGGQERCPDPCGYNCMVRDDLQDALDEAVATGRWMKCRTADECYEYECPDGTCEVYAEPVPKPVDDPQPTTAPDAGP